MLEQLLKPLEQLRQMLVLRQSLVQMLLRQLLVRQQVLLLLELVLALLFYRKRLKRLLTGKRPRVIFSY
jgi:hypothetical protein